MNTINLWPTTTTRIAYNIYDEKLRQLLRLPVRKGEIKEVKWEHGRLTVVFEKVSSTQLRLKLK